MKNNPAMAIPHSQPPKNKTMLPIKAAATAAEGVRKFRQHATVAATQLMTTDSHIPAVTTSPALSNRTRIDQPYAWIVNVRASNHVISFPESKRTDDADDQRSITVRISM
jgi:hypothetical protein